MVRVKECVFRECVCGARERVCVQKRDFGARERVCVQKGNFGAYERVRVSEEGFWSA